MTIITIQITDLPEIATPHGAADLPNTQVLSTNVHTLDVRYIPAHTASGQTGGPSVTVSSTAGAVDVASSDYIMILLVYPAGA